MTEQESQRWYQGITRYQWIVLIVASLGWVFDVFEGQIFVAAMKEAMPELTGKPEAPPLYKYVILAAFLLGGALGGVLFGMLSDRIGRKKTMSLTIIIYSAFTCFSAFAQNWWQMAGLRFLVAMGVGGEWAVASTLVAEVFPQRARARAQSIFHASSVLGTYLAVAAGTFVIANPKLSFSLSLGGQTFVMSSWRIAFLLGVLPSLLIIWIRLSLREPERWVQARQSDAEKSDKSGRIRELFSAALRRRTWVGVTLAAVGMATFWGIHIFGKDTMRKHYEAPYAANLPKDLTKKQRKEALKPHESIIKRGEMLGMFLVTTGGGLGLILFGPISERLGRRRTFLWYHLGGFVSAIVLFQVLPSDKLILFFFLPVFGFLTLGMHAGYAVYFPELFPTHLRGTGAGFCFNFGRVIAAPILILSGLLEQWGMTLENAATALSFLYLLVVFILMYAPETRGQDLPE